jgi:PKD domain
MGEVAGRTIGAPYVDVDEWREVPRPHRYVHGGFEDTHTRFSCYFPPAEQYRGRFFQYLEGGSGGHENVAETQTWMYRLVFEDLGGYMLESNQGHFPNEGMGFADEWELFGASAESALFAKQLATEMYGEAPHHGYVWGGSGGGSRSIYCLENRPDVYDGASPHVIWSSPLGSVWSPIGYWWLHAHHKLDEIVDATEPGGSGDPFATLSHDERDALAALYRYGYPRGAESQLWSFSPWTWGFVGTRAGDPGYYHDFWHAPGYLGHDDPARLAHLVIDTTTTVRKVITGGESMTDIGAVLAATAGAAREHSVGIVLDGEFDDLEAMFGATVTFTSGEAKGRSVVISTVTGDILSTSGEHAPDLFDGVEAGDECTVDNHDFVAWCHMFLHALSLDLLVKDDPRTGERQWLEGFEGLRAYALDDRPLHPQRDRPMVAQEGGGTGHSGRFVGKMIHVNATHDAQVWPNGVAAYQSKVRADKGDRVADSYRLWWVEHAPHGAPQVLGPALTPLKDPGIWKSRLVDYDGVTAQALRDLVQWAEHDLDPPPSTAYAMTTDGGITLADTAAARGGVQPVAGATANGGSRAEVRVGEPVRFVGTAEQPPGTGSIVAAEWDFDGTGKFARFPVDGTATVVTVEATHAYAEPGTYFACFRVGAHRDGPQGNPPFARNNARVRVIVTA